MKREEASDHSFPSISLCSPGQSSYASHHGESSGTGYLNGAWWFKGQKAVKKHFGF